MCVLGVYWRCTWVCTGCVLDVYWACTGDVPGCVLGVSGLCIRCTWVCMYLGVSLVCLGCVLDVPGCVLGMYLGVYWGVSLVCPWCVLSVYFSVYAGVSLCYYLHRYVFRFGLERVVFREYGVLQVSVCVFDCLKCLQSIIL